MDRRVYVFDLINNGWGFIALKDTQIQADVVHIPIESWTTETKSFMLCRVGYSQQRAAQLINGSSGAMHGPDLFVVTESKRVIASLWKPHVQHFLELAMHCQPQQKIALISESEDVLQILKEQVSAEIGLITIDHMPSSAMLKDWRITV